MDLVPFDKFSRLELVFRLKLVSHQLLSLMDLVPFDKFSRLELVFLLKSVLWIGFNADPDPGL
jgi:hypothetical protein